MIVMLLLLGGPEERGFHLDGDGRLARLGVQPPRLREPAKVLELVGVRVRLHAEGADRQLAELLEDQLRLLPAILRPQAAASHGADRGEQGAAGDGQVPGRLGNRCKKIRIINIYTYIYRERERDMLK